jgi:hypothetical protein
MLKEKNYLFSRLNQLLDFLVIVVAFFVALSSRNALLVPNFFPTAPIIHLAQHHWLIWIMAPVIIIGQMTLGIYNSQRLQSASRLFAPIALCTLVGVVVGLVAVFGVGFLVGTELQMISKPQIVYFGLWIAFLLMVKAVVVKRFFLPSVAAA